MEVLRNPRLKPILALNFCNYACTFTVQGLWGGPFLREVHGLSAIEAGNVLLGAVDRLPVRHARLRPARPPARHPQVDRDRRHPGDRSPCSPRWRCASQPPVWVPVAAILGIGFFSRLQHHGDDAWPRHLPGPADRARHRRRINTSVMLGVACMQTLSGVIVGAFEPLAGGARSEDAYRALFGVLTLVLIVAVAIYSRSQDVKPSDEMRAARQ